MRGLYITEIGKTKFGALNKSLPELLYEAKYKFIRDSPLKHRRIDADSLQRFCRKYPKLAPFGFINIQPTARDKSACIQS